MSLRPIHRTTNCADDFASNDGHKQAHFPHAAFERIRSHYRICECLGCVLIAVPGEGDAQAFQNRAAVGLLSSAYLKRSPQQTPECAPTDLEDNVRPFASLEMQVQRGRIQRNNAEAAAKSWHSPRNRSSPRPFEATYPGCRTTLKFVQERSS
jgi:hypothetical protein